MKASGLKELKISKEIIFHIIPWGPMKDKSVTFIYFLLVNYKPSLWMYIYICIYFAIMTSNDVLIRPFGQFCSHFDIIYIRKIVSSPGLLSFSPISLRHKCSPIEVIYQSLVGHVHISVMLTEMR